MKDYQIKIYIANENDTIDSICEKFQIDRHILLIFNPLLKNKVKITNLPIKIPYVQEIAREDKIEPVVITPKENLLLKNLPLIKTFIMYKILTNTEINELLQFIYQDIEKLSSSEEKNDYYQYLNELIKFIDNYQNLDENKFLFQLSLLEEKYSKINDDNINQLLLRYISELKNKNYESGELWFYNFTK